MLTEDIDDFCAGSYEGQQEGAEEFRGKSLSVGRLGLLIAVQLRNDNPAVAVLNIP